MDPIINTASRAALKAGDWLLKTKLSVQDINLNENEREQMLQRCFDGALSQLEKFLRKTFPHHEIVAGTNQCKESKADHWIINPISGKENFKRHIPHYAITLAFRSEGKTEHAVIFDPSTQNMFTASRGRGAQLNQRRIRIFDNSNSKPLHISIHGNRTLSSFLKAVTLLREQETNLHETHCYSLDIAQVAANQLDAFLGFGLYDNLEAESLLLHEAGGKLSHLLDESNSYLKDCWIAHHSKISKTLLDYLSFEVVT